MGHMQGQRGTSINGKQGFVFQKTNNPIHQDFDIQFGM